MRLEERLLTPLDPAYPVNLRALPHPPPLFCQGTLRPDDTRGVAVVGTRAPTPEGLRRTRQLAERLARGGMTVVSGLARGIDTAAHEACLDAGGRSIAVLGCGLGHVYPPENAVLADRIAAHGALLSQLPRHQPASSGALRRRNGVIAGIARLIVVMEAGPTSGARIAARLALAGGRPVLFPAGLVAEQEWARSLLQRPGVHVVGDEALADAVLGHLDVPVTTAAMPASAPAAPRSPPPGGPLQLALAWDGEG
ncbi:MAG: DNA-processing protein DprA [Candidatus Dormibacteria bacterium]|jgi:DNA processing protein